MTRQVRIQSVKIHNFKSIEDGDIRLGTKDYFFAENDQVLIHDVVGIYGPNGSGKSAVIEACEMVRNLLAHGYLPPEFKNFIRKPEEESDIEMEFSVKDEDEVYLIGYKVKVELLRLDDTEEADSFGITEEILTSKVWNKEKKKYNAKQTLCQFRNGNFSSSSVFDKVTRDKLDGANNLRDSCFFSPNAKRIIEEAKIPTKSLTRASKLNLLKKIILNLVLFSRTQWMVLMNHDYGEQHPFQVLPLNIMIESSKGSVVGQIPLVSDSDHPSKVPEELYPKLLEAINQMNTVLRELIPELEVEIKEIRRTFDNKGAPVVEFESGAKREDVFIPLKYESDGIKRIISILEAVIAAVNNPFTCIMIDELDAGIFEYLLGEIVKVLSEITKGQILFTAHNLHVFEKLNYKNVYVTTTEPSRRFTQFKNIKLTNNFRDSYYRALTLSSEAQLYMDPIKQYKIRRAFRKAGSTNG